MNYDNLIVFFRDFSTLIIELVTAIIGSIYFYKYKNSILKYFLFYLWFIVFIEYSAFSMREYLDIPNNKGLINSFYVIHFIYLFFTYWHVLHSKKRKLLISYFAIIYSIVCIINAFFEDFLTRSQTISFIVGSSFLILAIILYFIEILKSEKVLYVKKKFTFLD